MEAKRAGDPRRTWELAGLGIVFTCVNQEVVVLVGCHVAAYDLRILFKGSCRRLLSGLPGDSEGWISLGTGIYTKSIAKDRPSSTSVMPIQCKCKFLRKDYSAV